MGGWARPGAPVARMGPERWARRGTRQRGLRHGGKQMEGEAAGVPATRQPWPNRRLKPSVTRLTYSGSRERQ